MKTKILSAMFAGVLTASAIGGTVMAAGPGTVTPPAPAEAECRVLDPNGAADAGLNEVVSNGNGVIAHTDECPV